MKKLIRGMAICTLLQSFSTFAALPVEGGATNKDAIGVPTPENGGGLTEARRKGPLSDFLLFKDGDTLHGNMLGIHNDTLTWTRPDINAPIIMQLQNLRAVKLFKHSESERDGSKVELTNGDILYGDIISMTGEEFVMDTWYGGRLTLPRCMVRALRPGSTSGPLLLKGMGKLNEWTSKKGNWKVRGGKFSCSNSGEIGRKVKLGDAFHLQVTVDWSRSTPAFHIITQAKDSSNYYSDSLNLRVRRNHISLQEGQGSRDFGSANYSKLEDITTATFDLFIDTKKQVVALMINNELVNTWDTVENMPSGPGLIFKTGYNTTSFSQLKISQWDGKLPSAASGNKVNKTDDLVRFSNGDKMSGKVLGIEAGNVTLKTQFATMPVPAKNITSIMFNTNDSEDPRRNKGDVILLFPNGDKLTLKLISVKGGKLKGRSENFEIKEFDLRAFIGLEFNIYDDKDDDEKNKIEGFLFSE